MMIRLVVTGAPRECRTTLVEETCYGGLPRESRQDLGQQGSMPSPRKAKRLGSSKLMAALQPKGFSRRQSRRALHAVLRAWTEALERNEPVEVGVGWLVLARVRQRRRLRLGKIVDVPGHFLTIKLQLPKRSRRKSSPEVVGSLGTWPTTTSFEFMAHSG